MQYPITGILGRRGDGKTLFMTWLALLDSQKGRKIYSNYTLIGIPHEKITLSKVAELPPWLEDATILLDELQEGTDSREFFRKGNKGITKLATQLRKRRLTLYYTTQVLNMIDKRMREQTDYLVQVTKIQPVDPTHFNVVVFDREMPFNSEKINSFIFHGKPMFGYYNTREVISYDGEEKDN